jgi:signal peptidase I
MSLRHPVKRTTTQWFLKAASWLLLMASVITPSILHSQFGIGFSPILTGSMRPAAAPGDVFVTAQVKASTLKVGEIIAIHNQVTGVFYAHRIVEIGFANGLLRITTKGDANPEPEQVPYNVAPNTAVSKEITRIKWVGRPLVYLTSPQGRNAGASFLILANVLFLIYFLFRKEQKRMSNGEKIYRDLYAEAIAAQQESSTALPPLTDHWKGKK